MAGGPSSRARTSGCMPTRLATCRGYCARTHTTRRTDRQSGSRSRPSPGQMGGRAHLEVVVRAHAHLPKLGRHLADTTSLSTSSISSSLRLLPVRGLLASSRSRGVVGRLLGLSSVARREQLGGCARGGWVGDGRVKRSTWSVCVDVRGLCCCVLASLWVVAGLGGRGGGCERVVLSWEGRQRPIGRLGRVLPLRLPLRT